MASYLAKAGISTVLLEQELFPREHVGESLVPAANRVLSEIGFIDQMDAVGFPKKFGAAWTLNDSPLAKTYCHDFEGLDEANIQFSERELKDFEGHTWHVDRGKFDLLLLQHAASLGANVVQGVRVKRVDFEGEGVGIITSVGRKETRFDVKMVVDASGRKTFLGNQLKLRVLDPVFRQMAIHTWFEDFDRLAGSGCLKERDYIYIHFIPKVNTWVWQIPITDKITSIGVVCQKGSVPTKREERFEYFWECLKTRPRLYEALRSAKQLRPFKEEGDYSYAMKEVCGDKFVLVGDAARFVDPIFSSGVSVALNSARIVLPAIVDAVQRNDFRKSTFAGYEATLRRGVKNWYKFITLYYRLNVLFTHYVNNPETRLDVIKLLQGDVYDDEEPAVLRAMERDVRAVEHDPKHPWHAALGDLTASELQAAF